MSARQHQWSARESPATSGPARFLSFDGVRSALCQRHSALDFDRRFADRTTAAQPQAALHPLPRDLPMHCMESAAADTTDVRAIESKSGSIALAGIGLATP